MCGTEVIEWIFNCCCYSQAASWIGNDNTFWLAFLSVFEICVHISVKCFFLPGLWRYITTHIAPYWSTPMSDRTKRRKTSCSDGSTVKSCVKVGTGHSLTCFQFMHSIWSDIIQTLEEHERPWSRLKWGIICAAPCREPSAYKATDSTHHWPCSDWDVSEHCNKENEGVGTFSINNVRGCTAVGAHDLCVIRVFFAEETNPINQWPFQAPERMFVLTRVWNTNWDQVQ